MGKHAHAYTHIQTIFSFFNQHAENIGEEQNFEQLLLFFLLFCCRICWFITTKKKLLRKLCLINKSNKYIQLCWLILFSFSCAIVCQIIVIITALFSFIYFKSHWGFSEGRKRFNIESWIILIFCLLFLGGCGGQEFSNKEIELGKLQFS